MKKNLIGAIMLICVCGMNPTLAQRHNYQRSIESSPKIAEINKMVSLYR